MRFDLLILGDTPDAWAAAEESVRRGRRAAVLRPDPDGRGIATGLAAVLAAYGDDVRHVPTVGRSAPCELWMDAVARHERSIARISRETGVRSWRGPVGLTGPDSAEVLVEGIGLATEGDFVLLAIGTTARRPRGLSFDRRTVLLPEDTPHLTAAPKTLVVLGGNRTARAFARLFAAAGSKVRVIDATSRVESLSSCEVSVGEVLDLRRDGESLRVRLIDGREFPADAVLFAADRVGATASLGLAAAGLDADEDGRLWCDDDGRTWVPTIAAAGEVVGYPKRLREDTITARRIASLQMAELLRAC